MSASSTWLTPRVRRLADCLQRLRRAPLRGRKPNDEGRKSASNIGSNTNFAAICAMRSLHRRNPQRPLLAVGLRDVPPQHGRARYFPARSSSLKLVQDFATPYSSTASSVTAIHAGGALVPLHPLPRLLRTSLLQIRSYSAWKRRPFCCLAAP